MQEAFIRWLLKRLPTNTILLLDELSLEEADNRGQIIWVDEKSDIK